MQDSLDQKPDWLDDSMSLSLKDLYSSLNKSLSRACRRSEVKRQGVSF